MLGKSLSRCTLQTSYGLMVMGSNEEAGGETGEDTGKDVTTDNASECSVQQTFYASSSDPIET
jgi:hypothetical protein